MLVSKGWTTNYPHVSIILDSDWTDSSETRNGNVMSKSSNWLLKPLETTNLRMICWCYSCWVRNLLSPSHRSIDSCSEDSEAELKELSLDQEDSTCAIVCTPRQVSLEVTKLLLEILYTSFDVSPVLSETCSLTGSQQQRAWSFKALMSKTKAGKGVRWGLVMNKTGTWTLKLEPKSILSDLKSEVL
jgi:hypothetical protein